MALLLRPSARFVSRFVGVVEAFAALARVQRRLQSAIVVKPLGTSCGSRRAQEYWEGAVRATSYLLMIVAVLFSPVSARAQDSGSMPEIIRRSVENARMPSGHGVAFTVTMRQSWDFGGGPMRQCGEASYRFDPRAPRDQRFRNVRLEGEGRCQAMVANPLRRSMRHGRADIEGVEMGLITFGPPFELIRETPDSVTYSVRIVANASWNRMFGDEREPASEERLTERVEGWANFANEVTFERRNGRLLEMTQTNPEVGGGISTVRNMTLMSRYAPLTDTIAFPSQAIATGEARALLTSFNFRQEITYSDVEFVRLNAAAPVVADATGPIVVDMRSAR